MRLADEVLNLKREWEAADETQRRFMEKRYGKKVIRQVIEESFSHAWLEEFSKKCPQCNTNIQVRPSVQHQRTSEANSVTSPLALVFLSLSLLSSSFCQICLLPEMQGGGSECSGCKLLFFPYECCCQGRGVCLH